VRRTRVGSLEGSAWGGRGAPHQGFRTRLGVSSCRGLHVGIPLGHQPCTQFLVDSSLPLTAPHAPLLPQRVCRCRHTPSRFSTCRGWCGEGGRAAQAGRIRSMRCRRVFVGAGGPTEHYSGKANGVVEPFLAHGVDTSLTQGCTYTMNRGVHWVDTTIQRRVGRQGGHGAAAASARQQLLVAAVAVHDKAAQRPKRTTWRNLSAAGEWRG